MNLARTGSALRLGATDGLDLTHGAAREVFEDFHETLGDQPLRAPEQQWDGARRFDTLVIGTDTVDCVNDIFGGADLAADHRNGRTDTWAARLAVAGGTSRSAGQRPALFEK